MLDALPNSHHGLKEKGVSIETPFFDKTQTYTSSSSVLVVQNEALGSSYSDDWLFILIDVR